MNLSLDIAALAPPEGGREYVVCPFCGGGSTHSKSMVISTHNGVVSYLCFRANCGARAGLSRNTLPEVARRKEPRYYTRPTVYPGPEQHAQIERLYGLEPGTVTGYNRETDRFLLTVRGPETPRRGVVAYSLSGESPKSINYQEAVNEPFIHWAAALHADNSPVVVVEDWFSAEKVAQAGYLSVAILGTHLTADAVDEIASRRRPTVLAFDQDAYPKSLRYLAKYGERFSQGLTVWRLAKDLKYVELQRIQRAVNERAVNFISDT